MAGVTIDSVTTGDSAPAAAPHRISGVPTKTDAAILFTPTSEVAATVLGVRITIGGATPYTGKLVGRKGLPCSDQLACGESLGCSDWESPTGVQLSEDVTYAELAGEADGDKTVNVWADIDGAWL